MVVRGFSLKFFGCLVCLLVFSLGSAVSVWGASGDIHNSITTDVKEFAFNSYDEFLDWLTELEAAGIVTPEESEEILDQLTGEEVASPQATCSTICPPTLICLCTFVSPTSIDVVKPFRFEIIQIQSSICVGTAPCGTVLCSTVGYSASWVSAPGTGAFILGPRPGGSGGQICQGGSDTATVTVILTSSVPNGTWTLRFSVIGFGGLTFFDDAVINVTGK